MITLIVALIVLCLLGAAVWYLPLPPPFRGIAMAVLCLCAALWVLSRFSGLRLPD